MKGRERERKEEKGGIIIILMRCSSKVLLSTLFFFVFPVYSPFSVRRTKEVHEMLHKLLTGVRFES